MKATKISDEAISSWYRTGRGFTWLQMMRKKRNVSILGKKVYFFQSQRRRYSNGVPLDSIFFGFGLWDFSRFTRSQCSREFYID